MNKVVSHSLFTDFDIDLFKSGKHYKLHEKMGAHCIELNGVSGVYFAVWAPAAQSVSVVGNFNFWNAEEHPLNVRWDSSGIWEGFIPGLDQGEVYKYSISSEFTQGAVQKSDPFARQAELRPNTASVVHRTEFKWSDENFIQSRAETNALDAPISVYEVHLGSWKKEEGWKMLSYTQMAEELVSYVREMGYTHVEFMPVMEHPYDPSWGYQVTGYFAPTSRFGNPDEFKFLVNAFHKAGIGVFLDWVPSHFPEDQHGLGLFDGTHLYEHPDRKKGFHPDWKSLIFNYERNEVRSFLISNALFWLEEYHIDGLRVDAVASMLYLDYSREEGEWDPNEFGGNENLAAISFLKELNTAVYEFHPNVQMIAEESTSFNGVSKPVDLGGLGFGMKWMMGWMNDTLEYFKKDPIHRSYHQNDITFSLAYAFSENFMLPLSHDEVVYGKRSLLYRMPGDEWQRFANLRCLMGLYFTHPGAKLHFMGAEFGQSEEWDFETSLMWHLLDHAFHNQMQTWIKSLNHLYTSQTALYQQQFSAEGFEWLTYNDAANSVISFIRKGKHPEDYLIVSCNFTPSPRNGYRLGCPGAKSLVEVLNSDQELFGGSGLKNTKISIEEHPWQGQAQSFSVDLAPLGVQIFKPVHQ